MGIAPWWQQYSSGLMSIHKLPHHFVRQCVILENKDGSPPNQEIRKKIDDDHSLLPPPPNLKNEQIPLSAFHVNPFAI